MMNAPGPAKYFGYLVGFRRYWWGWTPAESFASPAEGGSATLMLPLDRCYRSRRVRWGFRDHYRGRKVESGGRESCRAGHGVTRLGGNDITSGACSSDRRHRFSRASLMTAAIVIAPLDRVRLEGQRPSDALEFLPRPEKIVQN
jgi:hypothetical protein